MESLLALVEKKLFYGVVAALAIVLTVAVFRGYPWMYWVNAGISSVCLGVYLLQIQIPSWRYKPTVLLVWGVALLVANICLHQRPSCQSWFGIQTGKKHKVVFWLLVGSLIALGQFVLPVIRLLSAEPDGAANGSQPFRSE